MHADLTLLHASPFARVTDFRCNHREGDPSRPEYQADFAISFTRKGAFEFCLGKRASAIHSGVVLLENPGTERIVRHYGALRDACTAIEIRRDFFLRLSEEDSDGERRPAIAKGFPASVLPATPRLEALHSLIFHAGKTTFPGVTLRIDALLIELLPEIAKAFGASAETRPHCSLDRKRREFYLENIDRAKNLMGAKFREELSLSDIARGAGISLFHFSRVFKQFTNFSPHQYLLHLRLEHADLLLRNTFLSVTQICFESGFNSLEHFISAFTRQYGLSPGKYRRSKRAYRERAQARLRR
jgi:AraC family transcriptional regulator